MKTDKLSTEVIDTIRSWMGTLPARTNDADWLEPVTVRGIERMKVTPVSPQPGVDTIRSIYRGFFSMATATWGDANIDGNWGEKWERASPEARYLVVWNVLHRQTLPTALESANFTIELSGIPRHAFDQIARARIGTGFGSIGCRDNSKLPAEFVLYSTLSDILNSPADELEEQAAEDMKAALVAAKKAYQSILACGKGSYQIARSFLFMSYHHQTTMTENLLAMMGMFSRRSCLGEEEFVVAFAYLMRKMLVDDYGLNMIGDVMRPTCHWTKKCHYVGSMAGGGVPGLFSNLFAPKDPECVKYVPSDFPDYAEFNQSCTDSTELKAAGVGYVSPGDYLNLPPDYAEAKKFLSAGEIEAFES